MLKRKTPAEFKTSLAIKSLGEVVHLDVTYLNLDADAIDAFNARIREANEAGKVLFDAELVPDVVKAWDSEYALTPDDLAQLDKDRPGFCGAVLNGFFQSRVAELRKN